jgi:hypothetical protein
MVRYLSSCCRLFRRVVYRLRTWTQGADEVSVLIRALLENPGQCVPRKGITRITTPGNLLTFTMLEGGAELEGNMCEMRCDRNIILWIASLGFE